MIIAEECLCIAAVVLRRWALTREGVGFPWSKNPGLHSASLKYWHVTNTVFHYSTRCSAILNKGELWTKPPAQERCRKRAAAAGHAKPNLCRTPALGSRHSRRQPPPPARRHSVLTVSLSPARSRRGAAGIFPVLEEERRGRKKQIFVCSPANAADPSLGGSLPRRGGRA